MDYLPSRRHLIIPTGALAGLTLGIIARAWMRWISTDPEFSWSGTIFILIAFVLFGTVHSFSYFAREVLWSGSRLRLIRGIAILLSLPLFSAAGSSMLPTVLTGSLALWRTDWWRWLRILLGISCLIIPAIIIRDFGNDFGWGISTIGRILLFMLIYATVISATRATVTPLLKN